MTFVLGRFSVGYKGHFLRWHVHMSACIFVHAYILYAIYLFMHIFYKPYGQQIQIHFENYAEIHFESQKSTWNTEI